MAFRRFISASGRCAISAKISCCSWAQFQNGLLRLLDSPTMRRLSSVAVQEKVMEKGTGTGEKWFELPPVPKAVPVRSDGDVNRGRKLSSDQALHEDNKKIDTGGGVQQLTAVRWVAKCCPSVPNSLIQKLFRLRQVRQRVPQTDHSQLLSYSFEIQNQGQGLKRVSGKAVVEEGAVLCVPKSVFQLEQAELLKFKHKKTERKPTTEEIVWLQSLVLHKDSQIIVINKPPGLPVQGGSDVRKSLDSLMGTALRYDYSEGPKLVHRLDKETSGTMVLARTQESATFLHALFRNKTATASSSSENDNVTTAIGRSYLALVMGTPRKLAGRISASLIKMVLDNGKSEKILVADDESSENAQVAITDYKVMGPSYYGCTWLELRPLTGRKHQLRVHCAEVLGTPVVGDFKYGWKSHRTWSEHLMLQDPETWSLAEGFIQEGLNNLETLGKMRKVQGSVMAKDPMLHLHCHELSLPDPARLLNMSPSQIEDNDWAQQLRFVAPLPPHMAVSKSVLSVF